MTAVSLVSLHCRCGGIGACSTTVHVTDFHPFVILHGFPQESKESGIQTCPSCLQPVRADSFPSMGVPAKGANVELTRSTSCGGLPPGRDRDTTLLSTAGVRENKAKGSVAAVAKLKRGRPSRGVKQQHKQHEDARQLQQHQRTLIPATGGSPDGSSQQVPTFPFLVHRQHSGRESTMRQNPAHVVRERNTMPEGGVRCPHNLTKNQGGGGGNVNSFEMWSHESTAPTKAQGVPRNHDRHVNDEQEVIRRRLDDLLSRPPPSFDYVEANGGERQHVDSLLHQEGDSTTSRSLPELFLSRAENRDDGSGGDEGGCSTRRGNAHQQEELQRSRTSNAAVTSNITASARRRANKPTRSQSGGLFRRAPCSSVGGASRGVATTFGRQDSNVSAAGTSVSRNAKVAASFKGEDAALLDQAFAFAETVAREEEAEIEVRLGRGGRRLGRGAGGSAARLPLHRGGDGGRLRRTRSSGSSVVLRSGGAIEGSRLEGGRVDVEDWVRGLSQSSPVPSEQLKPHQSANSSINQASTKTRDKGEGGLEMGHRETAGRRRKLVVGSRTRQEAESGALRFDRRREKEESKKAEETAELVKRFEEGTTVAALRAELEASRASTRRSAEAIEQVASRWHQQRSMATSVATS